MSEHATTPINPQHEALKQALKILYNHRTSGDLHNVFSCHSPEYIEKIEINFDCIIEDLERDLILTDQGKQ